MGALRPRIVSTGTYSASLVASKRFRGLWLYRELLRNLVERDIKVRYKRSVLGFAWMLLNPLITMIVFTVIFREVFNMAQDYALYVISALLLYNFFSLGSSQGLNSVVVSGALIRKVWVPKAIFPLASVCANFINFGLSLIPLAAVMIFTGAKPSAALLVLPIPIAAAFLFTFGVSLLLSLFLLLRGRIRIKEGFSGIKIERFDALERANHWMTAVSFIVLALTGLVLLYGRYLLEPWMGAGAFSGLASACLYLHIAFMPPFLIGAILMLALWLPQQIPNSADMRWLARFGGFLTPSKPNPPAYRFNAGQKIVFWGVLWGTVFAALSGFTLMFPFYWADITTMQWVLVAHAVVALLMIALILGHIYIGTIGMEGAFEAMWYGHVDRNWAAEHHRYWLDEQEREGRVRPDRPGVAPAE